METGDYSEADGYEPGQTIYALVWAEDGSVAKRLTHEVETDPA